MNLAKWTGFALLSFSAHMLLLGCPQGPQVPSDVMKADAESIVVVTPDLKTECESACTRLDALGCPEAKPASNGESCVLLCRRAASYGFLAPGCVANAHDKAELAKCQVRCRE
jgi:hypothetical protein